MVLGGEPPGRVGRRRDFSGAPAARAIAAAGAFFACSVPSGTHRPDRMAMADERRGASGGNRKGRPPAKKGVPSRGGGRGASGGGRSRDSQSRDAMGRDQRGGQGSGRGGSAKPERRQEGG